MADIKEPVKLPGKATVSVDDVNSERVSQLLSEGKVDEALKLIQAKKGLEALLQEEQSKRESGRLQENRLLAIQDEIDNKNAAQDSCSHTKDNGLPSVGGNRDSSNNTIFICLRCQKLWRNDELPMYLRNNLPQIGGPTFG
jgi:hypothetical protein